MRVAYYYHVPAISVSGIIFTTSSQARTLEDIASYAECVLLIAHRPRGGSPAALGTPVDLPNVKLLSLPAQPHTVVAWCLGPLYMVLASIGLRPHLRVGITFTVVRSPTTLAGWIARATPGPTILLVVGDFFKWASSPRRSRLGRFAARRFAELRWREAIRLGRRWPVLANGTAVFREWAAVSDHTVLVRTDSLRPDEVHLRGERGTTAEFRMLFVGRVEREKGIVEALVATAQLQDSPVNPSLRVIGPVTDPSLRLQPSRGVTFVGPIEFGDALFREYKEADVLLCLSHYESFPRVIWEALAIGVPIVATDVGSIRATVGDSSIVFVPPRNPERVVHAVEQLFSDPADCRRRALAGRALYEAAVRERPTVGEALSKIADQL